MRVLSSGCMAWMLVLSGCGANPATQGTAAAGSTAGGAAAAGWVCVVCSRRSGQRSYPGQAPRPGGASSTGGASPVGSAGAPTPGAGAGGGDNGGLFDPTSSVPFDPDAGERRR